MKSFLAAAFCVLLSMTAVAIPASAQCDGYPHPEKGQPAPCGQPAQPSLPNPNSDVLREVERRHQQEEQQLIADAEARERDRIHRCELQAQHDYEECTRRNPTGYCPLKPCY